MVRITFLFTLIGMFAINGFGQFNKKHLVEYFTNTLCSICANRNPGFHQNIRNNEDLVLITFHPSSPYSACVLNQYSVEKNDARTQSYQIYGGTPRLVLNGEVQSASTNYSDPNILPNPNSSEIKLEIVDVPKVKGTGELISASLRIRANENQSNLKLHVMVVEDTVFYAAPNGENLHYNVFRESLTPIDGELISTVSDSMIRNYSFNEFNVTGVDLDRLKLIVFCQDEEGNILQSEQFDIQNETGITQLDDRESNILVHRIKGSFLYKITDGKNRGFILRNLAGQIVLKDFSNEIDLMDYTPGVYLLELEGRVIKLIR